MKQIFLLSLLYLLSFLNLPLACAQDETALDFERFLEMVKVSHPISRQADIMLEQGDANFRQARGGFDPKLMSTYDYKQYDGKEYYRINNNELKWPTSIAGIALKAGYENNEGTFLNPENNVPGNGLAYAGIAVPLGAGMFFDERRQALRQAEVFQQSSDLERTLMINQLIFDASKAYWQWYAAWHIYQTYVESVMLAEERFEGLKMSFEQGDIPAIDTLEAYILVQNREVSKSEAQVGLIQARYELSNYLWSEDLQPLLLQENSKPVDQIVGQTDEAAISGWSEAEQMNAVHPLIRLYANKVEMLDFDRRMKAEKIKPKLNINYNVLNEPIGGDPSTNFSTNNYKWGFEFSMPLLLRQERGALQLAKLKILDANLALQQKSTEIFNKISAYQAEITLLEEQMKIYGKAVENYQALLQGERRKFEEGESSVFLINSRESSLISADVKLISLQGKYQKAKAGLVMAMGGLAATIP